MSSYLSFFRETFSFLQHAFTFVIVLENLSFSSTSLHIFHYLGCRCGISKWVWRSSAQSKPYPPSQYWPTVPSALRVSFVWGSSALRFWWPSTGPNIHPGDWWVGGVVSKWCGYGYDFFWFVLTASVRYSFSQLLFHPLFSHLSGRCTMSGSGRIGQVMKSGWVAGATWEDDYITNTNNMSSLRLRPRPFWAFARAKDWNPAWSRSYSAPKVGCCLFFLLTF